MEPRELLIGKLVEAYGKVDERLEEARHKSASQIEFHLSFQALRSELPNATDEEIYARIHQQRLEEIARLVTLSEYYEVQIADIDEGLVSHLADIDKGAVSD